jgi:ubiquitin-protein ligase E3 A
VEEMLNIEENRQEFVDLYIEHLFHIQCEKQIDSFKRGFYKLFDKPMLKLLYTPEELEQFVCGSKDLNFKLLKTVTRYMKPLHPKHEFVEWFWDIVLNDFTDD